MPLRRLTILVGTVIGAETAFYAVVAPLLPHFAHDLHLSKLSAGLLTGSYPAGVLASSLVGGSVSGRLGPKKTVLCGLAIVAVASVVFGQAQSIALLDATRFGQGIGGTLCWSGGMAWLTAMAAPDRRGAVIGTAMGAAIGGALFGPVLGAVARVTSTGLVFSGVAVAMALLLAWALTMPPAAPDGGRGLADTARALRDPDVRTAMWLVALPAVVFGSVSVLGPLRLDHLGFGGTAVGATFLICAAVEASESPVVGRVSDRLGRLAPIRVGLAVVVVLLLGVEVPDTGWAFAAGLVVLTAGLGVFWAPAMALLSDAADRNGVAQGVAFALTNLAWGMGDLLGAGGGGALARASSDFAVLLVLAIACAATLATLLARRPRAAMA